MRGEPAEAHSQGKCPPRPIATVADTAQQEEEDKWQQCAQKQLSVMARRRVRCDGPAEHVRQPAHERRDEAESPGAKEYVGEEPGEKQVNDEAPRHARIRGQEEPQQRRGIEDVAVHRGHIRHAAEHERIPVRDALPRPKRPRREVAERKAGDILVAVRVHEELPGQRRIRKCERGQGVRKRRPCRCEARRR